MKRDSWGGFHFRFPILLCFILIIFSVPIMGQQVKNLRCNYLLDPLGIDDINPRFSWEIVFQKKRNVVQSSFKVLVATREELLTETDADCWNSGEIKSDQSQQVKYEGKTLISCKRYYWKVKVTIRGINAVIYSEPSYFETGLLYADEWKAQWISAPNIWNWPAFLESRKNNAKLDTSPWDNRSPLFRKEFALKKEVKSARMYVSGLGYYEAFLNGKRIGDRQLDPAFSRYDKTILYATYDITPLLGKENAIGIMLGNGWYNMPSKAVWGFDHAPWRGKPRAIMQVLVAYTDGTQELITTDQTWKTAPAPVTFNSVRQGMIYDARLEQAGWDQAGFNDEKWVPVFVVPSPGGVMRAESIDPIREWKQVPPIKIMKRQGGRYLVDFGQDMAGWIRIKAKGSEGDTITIKYGEQLVNDSVFQGNIKVFTQGFVQTDRFILRDEADETFETKFTYHGFRFVEIGGYTGELTKDDLKAVAAGTDFRSRGTFVCSDSIINKIQRNTIWSFRSNFYGYPTDCPQREKNGWTGDAQLVVETGLWNFHSNQAYAKYLQDIADEQRNDGNLPAIIPSSGWGYYQYNGPDWIGAYIIIPWQMYIFDGDKAILAKHYEGMKRLIGFFTSKAENHILSYGLGDHTYERSKRNIPLTSTAYYYQFASIMARVSKLLGNENDHLYFSDLSEKIKAAFNEKFHYSQTGKYGNGNQTNQSCPLFMGLTEPRHIEQTLQLLVDTICENDNHIDAGILGAKFVPQALADNGRADVAYKVIRNRTFPGWGWWIDQGATTLWEEWDGRKRQQNASLNHIMFGDVSNWFYLNIAGIRPDMNHPGFKHFFIEPKLSTELDWCTTVFESNYGAIHVDWKKSGQKLSLKLTVPCNTTATVTLPVNLQTDARESGRSLKKSGLTFNNADSGKLSIEVGSGTYEFECENHTK